MPGFLATTGRPVPVPRFGTLPLAASSAWSSPSRAAPRLRRVLPHIEAPGSLVPYRSLSQARATFMPDAAWPESRSPSRLIPRLQPGLDFGVITRQSRHVTGGIAFARLPDSHLTPSGDAFCRNAHHPGHCADAACGGLEPPPTSRPRGTYPHLLHSIASGWKSLLRDSLR